MKKQIILKKNEEHRILSGHQWVFSNEISSIIGDPLAGDIVELLNHHHRFLGIGFFNPNSLISFRLLSTEAEDVTFDFFEKRISHAHQLRQKLFPHSETYRLVYGESDFLPGLIIDKYNEYLSVQTLSFGMDKRLRLICDVLDSIFHPKAIVERNDSPIRSLEKLPEQKGIIRGTLDETIIVEHGLKFKVDLLNGQKTGFFLDQRDNRKTVRKYVNDARVLDAFCYEGSFALNASEAKAKTVYGFDQSSASITKARMNAKLNEADHISFEVANAFDKLKSLVNEKDEFDVVILDPPSFTRSKKNVSTALKGYKEINELALKLLASGGFLISASCSHHITQDSFLSAVEDGSRKAGRKLQLLEFAGASPDHPVLPAMPETGYLKFAVFAVA